MVPKQRIKIIDLTKKELLKYSSTCSYSELEFLIPIVTTYALTLISGIYSIREAFPLTAKVVDYGIISQCPECHYDTRWGLPYCHILNISMDPKFLLKFIHSRWTRYYLQSCYTIKNFTDGNNYHNINTTSFIERNVQNTKSNQNIINTKTKNDSRKNKKKKDPLPDQCNKKNYSEHPSKIISYNSIRVLSDSVISKLFSLNIENEEKNFFPFLILKIFFP